MRFVLLSALAAGVLALPASRGLAQDRDFSKVEIKVAKVAGSVYMLEGAGGNIGVSAGEDGLVVVDSQFAPLVPKIEAALAGISNKPVRFLLNTHLHGDHTGGNAPFAAKKVEIIAQENVRKRLASGGKSRFGDVPPAEKAALPIVTFNDRLTIHLNGEDIRAIHMPHGHTDGDAVIYFTQSNVVHMGDDFVTYGFPFVDLESGGSVQGIIAGAEKAIADLPDDVKIIPGHGPVCAKADVRKFVAMLKDTLGMVEQQIAKKKTLDDVKKAKLFDAKYAAMGKDFINADTWAEILYQSLMQAKTGPKNDHGHRR